MAINTNSIIKVTGNFANDTTRELKLNTIDTFTVTSATISEFQPKNCNYLTYKLEVKGTNSKGLSRKLPVVWAGKSISEDTIASDIFFKGIFEQLAEEDDELPAFQGETLRELIDQEAAYIVGKTFKVCVYFHGYQNKDMVMVYGPTVCTDESMMEFKLNKGLDDYDAYLANS